MSEFKFSFDINKDYYAVLGVQPGDSDELIKKAYRRIALKYHPDRCPGLDTDRFDQAAQAYEILGNQQKRKLYDRHRTPQSYSARHQDRPQTDDEDFEETFQEESPDSARPPEPEPDLWARVEDLKQKAIRHRAFRDIHLGELKNIEENFGLDTTRARQEILDIWMKELKEGALTGPEFREIYLAELAELEKKHQVDASPARLEILEKWVEELVRAIKKNFTANKDKIRKLIQIEKEYGYDTGQARAGIASHISLEKEQSDKEPRSFNDILQEKLRQK